MKTEFHRMFAETMADRFNFPKNFEFIEILEWYRFKP